jgi:guanylate kinase
MKPNANLPPHIISISGPSLSGKTELVKRIKDVGAIELVSHTTRPRRGHEIDGVHYNFVTPEQFEEIVKHDGMLQTSNFNGNWYGMSAKEVQKQSNSNVPLLWVVTPESIAQIESQVEKNPAWTLTKVLVFNEPEVLVERLLERFKNDTESDNNNYAKRLLSLITKELPEWTTVEAQKKYDKIIKNFGANNEKEVVEQFLNEKSPLHITHPEFCQKALKQLHKKSKTLKA